MTQVEDFGKELVQYAEKYRNTPTYNEVLLAMEFALQTYMKYYE